MSSNENKLITIQQNWDTIIQTIIQDMELTPTSYNLWLLPLKPAAFENDRAIQAENSFALKVRLSEDSPASLIRRETGKLSLEMRQAVNASAIKLAELDLMRTDSAYVIENIREVSKNQYIDLPSQTGTRNEFMEYFTKEVDISGKESVNEVISSIGPIEQGSMVRIRLVGSGPVDSMARLDPEGMRELIESRIGCKVTNISIESTPPIDLDSREGTGDFVSAVISYGKRLESASREELLDMICFTNTAKSMRGRFETFSDDELRQIVRDATYMIVEKMAEASR